MTTGQTIDRQAQIWSLGIGLAGAALLLAAAAAGASKRSRAARTARRPEPVSGTVVGRHRSQAAAGDRRSR